MRTRRRACRTHGGFCREKLNQLWQKYFPGKEFGQVSYRFSDTAIEFARLFGCEEDALPNADDLTKISQELDDEAVGILRMMNSTGLEALDANAAAMIRIIFLKLNAVHNMVQPFLDYKAASLMQGMDFQDGNQGLWRFKQFKDVGAKDPGPNARLKIYALRDLASMSIKRYQKDLVIPLMVPSTKEPGVLRTSCALTYYSSIHDYVKHLSGIRLHNIQVWTDIAEAPGISALDNLEKYLIGGADPEVPEIVKQREVISFSNGVYLLDKNKFVDYDDAPRIFPRHNYPVAAKHHDVPFDATMTNVVDLMSIPTEDMEKIMNTQQWSFAVKFWFYVLCGRMLYDLGKYDDWQVVAFLKGLAGTGKSVILNFISSIYDDSDVGILSNTVEKQFGLGFIVDKFIAIADDIRKNMQLDQSEFQNAVSGNGLSCAVKYKEPKIIKPSRCVMLWSGNEPPDFHDNSGSVGRRFVPFLFDKIVDRPDGELADRLKREMPAFICKTNRCYRYMVQMSHHRGIWTMLPREFRLQREELTATSNALIGLLDGNSGMIRRARIGENPESIYMPLDHLLIAVNAYAQSHNLEKPRWGPDYYRGPLALIGAVIAPELERKNYPRNTQHIKKGKYVYGIDLEEACEQAEANGGEVFAAAAAAAAAASAEPLRKRLHFANP